ncbi:sensor histidine kinase [Paenibacillus sp. CF384]|uniref:sensor histidine kinase n=1 Tax=Paenibacillus sp. CF384 TaxID=1884382 RepID=UPI0008959A66|nr:histidine kinase [Paenibacillus sp. CF384]SDW90828.1 two-component system, sensor histidine kinase YesM [Paenibacillus sp. CF384]
MKALQTLRSRIRFRIYEKLVAAFLLTLIPILTISFLVTLSSEATIRKDISVSLRSKVHSYLSTFETEMTRIIRMKERYMVDEDVQNLIMFHEIMPFDEQRIAMLSIQEKLRQFRDSSLFVEGLKLMVPELGRDIQDERIDHNFPADEINALTEMRRTRQILMPVNDKLILGDSYPNDAMSMQTPEAWLEVVLSTADIESSLLQFSEFRDGQAVLFDQGGKWTLGVPPKQKQESDETEASSLKVPTNVLQAATKDGIGRFELDGTMYYFARETSELLHVTLLMYVPEKTVLGPLDWYKQLLWILAATSILVILVFSLWIYRLIHRPIQRLTMAFRQLEKGEFQQSLALQYRYKDQFSDLYQQFNYMSSRLKQLIQDVYEQELSLKRAELKQLQSQINPHFLYNIFFLLNRILQFEDVDNAKALTRNLGTYFRYITRSSSDEVELQQEMDHVRSYAAIQSIRFGSKLQIELDELPTEAKTIRVPRLILQPIVENAFEYGLEDHPDQGQLRISCALSAGLLTIQVEDNGENLSDDLLKDISSRMKIKDAAVETTGMLNVHHRLQLSLGSSAGLSLSRSALGGLAVRIQIPAATDNGIANKGDV